MRDLAQLFDLKRLLMTTDSASLKSSEGTCSSIGDEHEKVKLEQKIEKTKEKLKLMTEKQSEGCEKFLSATKTSETSKGVNDNPQIARIRSNFERQNKKHNKEIEQLQKKLATYEERYRQIIAGELEPSPSRPLFFPSGIRKAKGVTETVMNAQMELAQRVKSAFSADNVNSQNAIGGGRTGQSTFFTIRRSADAEDVESSDRRLRNVRGSSTLPPNLALSSPDPLNAYKEEDFEQISRPGSAADTSILPYHTADNSLALTSHSTAAHTSMNAGYDAMQDQLKTLVEHLVQMEHKYDKLQDEFKKDIRFYAEALEEERFKTTKLEALLNEAIEMQSAEILNMKHEMTLASRLDMCHDERFRNIEENQEAMQNHFVRNDNLLLELRQVESPNTMWQRVALTGGNIVVEILKLALFILASILDLVRPLTGSRTRAGIAITITLVALFFGHHLTKIPLPFISSSNSSATLAVDGPPK